jgi:hypothetical protein
MRALIEIQEDFLFSGAYGPAGLAMDRQPTHEIPRNTSLMKRNRNLVNYNDEKWQGRTKTALCGLQEGTNLKQTNLLQ